MRKRIFVCAAGPDLLRLHGRAELPAPPGEIPAFLAI